MTKNNIAPNKKPIYDVFEYEKNIDKRTKEVQIIDTIYFLLFEILASINAPSKIKYVITKYIEYRIGHQKVA